MSKKKKSVDELLEEALVPEEEWPYEVPGNWVWVKLNSVISNLQYGYTASSSNDNNIGPHLLRITDIQNSTVDWDAVPYCEVDPKNYEKYRLHPDDIVVARTGATTGKSYLINNPPEAVFASYLIRLTTGKQLLPKYLWRYMNSPEYWKQITVVKKGSAQPGANAKILGSLSLPFPPLDEQKRISIKLQKLLNKVDRAKQLIEEAKETFELRRAAILDKAFRGELTEVWRKERNVSQSASNWLQEIKSKNKIDKKEINEYTDVPFELPNNWKWVNISDLGRLARGKSKHRPRNDPRLFGGEFPFIQTGDVARAKDYLNNYSQTLSEFGYNQSRMFPEGTVCITIAANIADTAILQFPSCFPDSVVGFNLFEGSVSPEYIHFYLTTIKSNIEQYAPATAQKNINLKILNEVMVPLPPKEEHDLIIDKIRQILRIEEMASNYVQLEESLEKLRQSILSKAYRGELGTNDSSEESALEILKEVIQP